MNKNLIIGTILYMVSIFLIMDISNILSPPVDSPYQLFQFLFDILIPLIAVFIALIAGIFMGREVAKVEKDKKNKKTRRNKI